MSLFNKYRPTSFDEIKGNKQIISSLPELLQKDNRPHSFLIHGPTGCGKTTVGRIIANELGCVGSDFREVDSADFRGIDTIREIRKNSLFKPLEGKVRVWLIDECNKLTNDAQNALLKILEDSPPHVYFVLCTTDPQKLIPAIKGRCAQYQVAPLLERELFGLLRKIARNEGETLEKEILDQIIESSQGFPRNAIMLLEQVLSADPEERLEISKRNVEIQAQVIELCRVLVKQSAWKSVAEILKGLKDQDPEGIRRAVLGYCQAILLKGKNNIAGRIMEEFLEPFYNTGFPGLTYACYAVIEGN